MSDAKERMLVWFSCGAASAVAAKEALARYGNSHEVIIVNCDTRPSEHPDNYRFSREVERWLGVSIVYLHRDGYATVDDVFERHRYMAGVNGARCTTELKKVPRLHYARPDDIHVFGFDAKETRRIAEFASRNPELRLCWVLRDAGITKAMCFDRLREAGIELPAMYRLGFANNNCPGCVKSSSPWYWDMIRTHFPDVFARRCEQSRQIGCRLVRVRGKRIFLDELSPGPFKPPRRKENLSCGPECGGPPAWGGEKEGVL